MAKTIKNADDAIKTIKERYNGVVKDYEIPPLVNLFTGETVGFSIILQLNTKYSYNEAVFGEWKQMLDADDWNIHAKCNKLRITFNVRQKQLKGE